MSTLTKRFLSVLLSAAIACQGFPAPALAEAAEVAAQGGEGQAEDAAADGVLEQGVEPGSETPEDEAAPSQDDVADSEESEAEPADAAGDEADPDADSDPEAEADPAATDDDDADPDPEEAEPADAAGDGAEAEPGDTGEDGSEPEAEPDPEDSLAPQANQVFSGTWGSCPWEITDGVLTVHPGNGGSQSGKNESPWYSYNSSITSVVFAEEDGSKVVAPADSHALLRGLESVWSVDASGLDTSAVTDMGDMFYGCSSLKTVYVGPYWSTGRVNYSERMFSACVALVGGRGTTYDESHTDKEYARVDGGPDTDEPGYLSRAPYGTCGTCVWDIDADGVLTIHAGELASNDEQSVTFWPWHELRWRVTSVVLDGEVVGSRGMACAFREMENLESAWLGGLDTSEVTDMLCMFDGCPSLGSLDLTGWDTSRVTDMGWMFCNCSSLVTIEVGPGWSTAALENSRFMFGGCESLVGGRGTTYDANHKDKEYARVDGGPDAPGYLTLAKHGTWGTCPWEINADGKLTVRPGEGRDQGGAGSSPWAQHAGSITSVEFVVVDGAKAVAPADSGSLLRGLSKVVTVDSSGLDTSAVTNMSSMFDGCSSLETLDLSGWDTSRVTRMDSMFEDCSSLSSLDLSAWDTSSVTSMSGMFSGCSSLASLDLSGWVTSSVMDMGGMFENCRSLASLDLSGWVTSEVSNMSSMFYGCSSLSSLDLSGWVTSEVYHMSSMFDGCSALETLDLSGWDTSKVTAMYEMFYGCGSLATIGVGPGWSTENVTSGDGMFLSCYSLVGGSGTTYDADHTGVEYARVDGGPDEPGYLTFVPRGTWGTCPWKITADGKLTVRPGVGESQGGAESSPWADYEDSITSVEFVETNGRKVVAPADSGSLLRGLSKVVSVDASGLDTSAVTSMTYMFDSCSSLETLDPSGWDTSKVTRMRFMFYGCSSLSSLDLSGWDTSRVTDMHEMFKDCSSLETLDLSAWDTSRVTDMASMFFGCGSLASLDPSGWDTSNVTDMGYMFDGCSSLASLDPSGWDTSNVTEMRYMFDGCSSLASLDLSGWDTSSVTDIHDMFDGCGSLATIGVGPGWSTENVTSGDRMFLSCYSLVGGRGTTYDGSHVDKEYARVDGGPEAPGYLTFAVRGTCGTCAWDLDADGVLTIHAGTLASNDERSVTFWPWRGLRGLVTSVVLDGEVVGSDSMAYAFSGMENLESAGLSGLDASEVTDMRYMFDGCSSLESLDLSGWDTFSVTRMDSMFEDCSSLESLDLSGWVTSSLTNMALMFSYCGSLSSIEVGPGWSTAAVSRSANMFANCTAIEGGSGTTYDPGHTDAEYARVDGGPDAPGYLTLVPWDVAGATIAAIADQVYTGGELTPALTVTMRRVGLAPGDDYTVEYADNVDVGEATVTIRGKEENYTGSKETTFKIVAKPISGATVSAIASQTYTGSAIKPAVTVKDGSKTLKAGTDYALSYANNTNVGTASITITGRGNYTGSKKVTFKVVAKPISGATVSAIASQTYTGSAIKPAPTVKVGGRTLKSGTDYALSHANNTNVGTASITITGRGNYTGSKKVTFKVVAKSISGATISAIADKTYTGSTIKPAPTVKVGGRTLKSGTDYTLSYSNNTKVGTATVTVTGRGNYAGTKTATFKIVAASVAKATVSAIANQTYTGSAIKPTPTVKVGSRTLKAGTDYARSYKSNTKVGTATLTITGRGNYEGTKSVTFKVVAAEISKATVARVADQAYTGKPITPSPKVTFGGKVLKPGTDYALAYADNTKPGTATITLTGRGNFKGTRKVTFRIVAPAMREFPDVPKDHWAHDAIGRAAALGVINGYADGTYGPSDRITRAQIAVMLWNMSGKPEPGAGARRFSDVTDPKAYYYKAVAWAGEVGVVNGYPDGSFGPYDDITREQLCVMAANYATKVGKRRASGSESDYASMPDAASVHDYARPAVGWAYREGVLPVRTGKLDPQAKADRAQAAWVVMGTYDFVH